MLNNKVAISWQSKKFHKNIFFSLRLISSGTDLSSHVNLTIFCTGTNKNYFFSKFLETDKFLKLETFNDFKWIPLTP